MPQKTWVIGEEVLAADFNTYIQNQVVPKFSTVAARDAAYPAATAGAGAYCDTADTGTLWRSNGSAWLATAGPTPWIDLPSGVTMTNGWVIHGSAPASGFPGYRRVGDMAQMRGLIKSGTLGAAAFTLPAAYWPPADTYLASVVSANVVGTLTISSAGVVTPGSTGTNSFFSLNAIWSLTR